VADEFDNEASLKDAQARLPLKRLMEQYGHAPAGGGHWKSFTCPFCKKKEKSAGVFERDGVEMFKCQSTSCPTAAKAMPAVQYVAYVAGLSNRDAFIEYLKMAGVWKEKVQSPTKSKVQSPKAENPQAPKEPNSQAPKEPNSQAPKEPNSQAPKEPNSQAPKWEVPGQAALEDFFERLTDRGAPTATGEAAEEATASASRKTAATGSQTARQEHAVSALSEEDSRRIFEKRGLTSATQMALGFRSNPRGNKEILLGLRETHSLDELFASGLWKGPDKKRKKPPGPNNQFAGAGIIRKLKPGEKCGRDQWRDEDDHLWGWCEPVLIPYFNNGKLIGLRPHKGMAKGGTLAGEPKIYVPQAPNPPNTQAPNPPTYSKAVITEGEFKVAALWQQVGAGRTDERTPWGVAALPGITFGKHFAVRSELELWLRAVGCQHVVVAFDHEEKPPEAKGRFDSIVWARYLATDLHRKLHLRAEVCVLPSAWANGSGKADWDGALAKLVKEWEKPKNPNTQAPK